ncbi:hypothetical protein Abac_091_002 [Acetobacter aceti NBRC 14818]|nr:hypothetical protein Abac_091_002 [Acetobacter aceti NBRC 14818]
MDSANCRPHMNAPVDYRPEHSSYRNFVRDSNEPKQTNTYRVSACHYL